MAIALLMCLSSVALAQEAPEEPSLPPSDEEVVVDATDEVDETSTPTEDAEAQAQLDHPFGHTRTMFRPNRMRANR